MPFSLEERSFICAAAANAVYFKAETAKGKLSAGQSLSRFSTVTDYVDTKTDSQAFIASNNDVVLVAFRGTEGKWQDILTDARTHLVKNEQGVGLVHTGFQTALHELMHGEARLFAAIKAAMQGRQRQLWLTGHSLGAALATLAAQFCAKQGIAVTALCTFGAPMVGDSDFAEAFDKQFFTKYQRYVHHNDIVPRLPSSQFYGVSVVSLAMQSPIGPYRQVGSEYYIDQNNEITVVSAVASESPTATCLPISLDSVGDHHLVAYIKAVRLASVDIAPNPPAAAFQRSVTLTMFGADNNDLKCQGKIEMSPSPAR